MPEPVSIIATLVAGGLGAYSALSSAASQRKAAEFNAQVADNQAASAENESRFEADRIRSRNRRLQAAQKAAYSASGVLIEGSVTDVMLDSATQGELDVASAEYGGRVKAQAYRSEASLSRSTAKNATTSGYIGAASSLLSSAASSTSTYASYRDRKAQLSANRGKYG